MDHRKTGGLISALRRQMGLTQRQLADRLMLSDRTISKWERGLGAPDVSLLPQLARELQVSIEALLAGELEENDPTGGNMKQSHYYVCRTCGALTVSTGGAIVSCCGKQLEETLPQKAAPEERLSVAQMEDEWYLTSDHPMTKDHFISFVAFATGDQLQLVKRWPEWDLQVRLPRRGHGILLWYCSRHGLFWQPL